MITIAGDSHTQACRQALTLRPNAEGFDIVWIKGPEGSAAAKNGDIDFGELVERVSDRREPIAMSLLGNLSNAVGLAVHDQPFYVMVDGEEGDGEMITRGAMRDLFESRIRPTSRRFLRLRQSTPAPIYHLATPPPKGDQERLQALLKNHGRKVNRPAQRLALWQIEMEVVRDLCAEWGVEFIEPPAASRDSHGFLRPEYYAADITHANAAYGELVLRQLEELVADRVVASDQKSLPVPATGSAPA